MTRSIFILTLNITIVLATDGVFETHHVHEPHLLQAKPLFQPSSKTDQSVSSTSSSTPASSSVQPAPQSTGQPLSYAQFIVQSKGHDAPPQRLPSAPQTERPFRVAAGTGAGSGTGTGAENGSGTGTGTGSWSGSQVGGLNQATRPSGVEVEVEEHHEGRRTVNVSEQKQEAQRSEGGISLGPKAVGSGSSIVVNPRQVKMNDIEHVMM